MFFFLLAEQIVLRVVSNNESEKSSPASSQLREPQRRGQHQALLSDYFRSYRVRNYSPATINKERRFLEGWFEEQGAFDLGSHGANKGSTEDSGVWNDFTG